MAYSTVEFENIKKKYGKYSTWAIWSKDRTNENSVNCIGEDLESLNSSYILIGLNMSRKLRPWENWENFRGGKHDRKLKYALNDSPLRGAYMTDLFKDINNPNSVDFLNFINENPELIDKNVKLFKEEMNDIKVSSETKFIILGGLTGKLYKQYFNQHFREIEVLYHKHYSARGTDEDWVKGIWKELGIEADFNKIKEKYK